MSKTEQLAAWDPEQYLRFAGERFRPFFDLIGRIPADSPAAVADLGCGTGELTLALQRRWPEADVLGLDSSPQMIGAARRLMAAEPAGTGTPRLPRFVLDDVRTWRPGGQVEVMISNAVLQWVPAHQELIARWAGWLPSGGWLAFQVPANFTQPSQQILRDLAASPRWRDDMAGVILARQVADPAQYLDQLVRAGCEVDAWETTYFPVLQGENPVVEWYRGSGLRPVLAALGPERAGDFITEYTARIGEAYPAQAYGTLMPFRRVFAVARRR